MNKKSLRAIAEESLLKNEVYNNKRIESLSPEEVNSIIHELEVHKVELEMQNEELKKSQTELEVTKERYFELYDLAPEGYLVISDKGMIIESNLTAANMLGYARSKLLKQRLSQYIYEEDVSRYYNHRKKLFESLDSQECELRMLKNDGSIFWGHMKANVVLVEGKPTCRLIFSDISERKKTDFHLQEIMEDLLESQRIAHLGTWRLNLATNQVVWSKELYKMFGFDPTLPPPNYTEHMKLFTPESWDKLSTSLEKTRTTGIPYELELETITQTGSNGWLWARGEAEVDAEGNILTLWGAAQDITERKRVENELIYLCYHDHLTELHNRRFFEKELVRLDVKENWPLSIIMFDVNGLKMVNDSFGHKSGDELLKKAAEVIRKACREEDVIARIGGDEFAVLLPKTTSDETLKIANYIKELATNEKVNNIELSISYGYESKTTGKQSISDVIGNAENHMYQHKLYERSSLRSNTIDLIMSTLFEKSNREAMHSNKVSFICQSIATKMKLDNNTVSKMKIAGLIHDIGKIGVQEEILNKQGSLTIDERRDVQRHPEIGWRLLSSTNEFSELAKFVLAHHEKWDGSGYPSGTIGEAIPLEARIIAVADAYDAMTSERSYRKKFNQEDAIKEMKRCSGTHFDPKIVDVFVNQVLSDNKVI